MQHQALYKINNYKHDSVRNFEVTSVESKTENNNMTITIMVVMSLYMRRFMTSCT
jgi:hypothetical protein